MTVFPEFKQSLREWVLAARKHLLSGGASSIDVAGLTRWVKAPQGGFTQIRAAASWSLDQLETVFQLPEWQQVRAVVEQNPKLAGHFDVLVGTSYGATRWDLESVGRGLLPRVEVAPHGGNVTVEPHTAFANRYRELEEVIASDVLKVERIWPMIDLQLTQPRLVLEPGVMIRELTPEEFIKCLNVQLIAPEMFRTWISPEDAKVFALSISSSVQKRLGNASENRDDFQALHDEEQATLDDFRATLGVLGKNVTLGPSIEKAGWMRGSTISRFMHGQLTNPFWMIHKVELGPADARLLQTTWSTFRQGKQGSSALHTAALRLYFARSRPRSDDRILDVMIAAEALYLGTDGGEDRGELKYRLALRAAAWADLRALRKSKKQVFDLLRLAYDVRSAIAHGSRPKASKLKLQGATLTLEQLIEQTTEVVMQGLLKALKQLAKSKNPVFRPDWESLILR
jgi:hypothetical protein